MHSLTIENLLVAPEVQDILKNFELERVKSFCKGLKTGTSFRFLNGSANMPIAQTLPKVAQTEVNVICSEEQAALLMKALHDSDIRLASRETSKMHWDWQYSTIESLGKNKYLVSFGVIWHNPIFYYIRRDAWMDMFHLNQYSNIGLNPKDFKVMSYIKDFDPTRPFANFLAKFIPYQSKGSCPFFKVFKR